jgi:hypothetical protein
MPTMTVSIYLLQFLAKQRVQRAGHKKRDDYPDEDEIAHKTSSIMSEGWREG